jgi:ParB family chromosome partitioning protein
MGCEIYEAPSNRLPAPPQKPLAENFTSEEEYSKAEYEYDSRLLQYQGHSAQINKMVEDGQAQSVVDVSRLKPELCYRFVPNYETQPQVDEETVEKLQEQDRRNKEIAIEKSVEETIRYLKGNTIPGNEFTVREQELFYYVLFAFLRKDNYEKFGVEDERTLTDEEIIELMTFRSVEQENTLRRDFIIHFLTQTSGDCKKSKLLLEFARIHFSDKVAEIKNQYNETYRKRHEKIEERIREIKPFSSENAEDAVIVSEEQTEETVSEPETAESGNAETVIPETPENDPDTEEISVYPGLPEHARVGEIPEEEEEMFTLEGVEIAA